MLRQSCERELRELTEAVWISGAHNPSDLLTKVNRQKCIKESIVGQGSMELLFLLQICISISFPVYCEACRQHPILPVVRSTGIRKTST